MYSMVTIVNTVVYLYLKVAKRVGLKSSRHIQKYNCGVMDMLTNLIVVIILQYIHISNHHIVYLKLTQYYI